MSGLDEVNDKKLSRFRSLAETRSLTPVNCCYFFNEFSNLYGVVFSAFMVNYFVEVVNN